MKYLAILEPAAGKTQADFAPLVMAEGLAIWDAYRGGSLREMYFQPAPLVATLVIEAVDEAAVHIMLAMLPFVAQHLFTTKVIMLGPWLPLEKMFDASFMNEAPHA